MTAAAIPPAIAPRVGQLLRMIASPVDGEVLAACRALSRTLGGAGLDLHALAEAVERPAERVVLVEREPAPTRRRKAQAGDVVLDHVERRAVTEALRRALAGDRLSAWEQTFAASIAGRLSAGLGLLTERQSETLARLLRKIGKSAAWV